MIELRRKIKIYGVHLADSLVNVGDLAEMGLSFNVKNQRGARVVEIPEHDLIATGGDWVLHCPDIGKPYEVFTDAEVTANYEEVRPNPAKKR